MGSSSSDVRSAASWHGVTFVVYALDGAIATSFMRVRSSARKAAGRRAGGLGGPNAAGLWTVIDRSQNCLSRRLGRPYTKFPNQPDRSGARSCSGLDHHRTASFLFGVPCPCSRELCLLTIMRRTMSELTRSRRTAVVLRPLHY